MTRRQLLALGLTRHEVDGLLRRGVLQATPYRPAYRAGGAPQTGDAQAWLSVLGSGSVLSYLSAAQWWELPVPSDGRIHITRRERARFRAPASVCIHRTLLCPAAITERFGLPITAKRETILDCLGWLTLPASRSLLDRSFQQSWLTRDDICRRVDEQSGRWGNRRLVRLLRESRPGAEAESERLLHLILESAGITGWTPNLPVVLDGHRYRIDVAFADLKIAIEVEGWAFHRFREQRDHDLEKLNSLAAHGWTVLVFNWAHVKDDPDYVIRKVCSVLGARPAI